MTTPSEGIPLQAYLVEWVGTAWGAEYLLDPAGQTTVGRSPDSDIVVSDDLCSRTHCVITRNGDEWTLVDKSRNGTRVDGVLIDDPHPLEDGEVVQLGVKRFAFTFAPEELSNFDLKRIGTARHETVIELDLDVEHPDDHRILRRIAADEVSSGWAKRDVFKRLYSSFREIEAAGELYDLAERTATVLMEITQADIAAVLTEEPSPEGPQERRRLKKVAYHSRDPLEEARVSEWISRQVYQSGEALLAVDISEDESLSKRASLADLQAESVICVPLRKDGNVRGLLHLYRTKSEESFLPEHLELAVTVADHMSAAMTRLDEPVMGRNGSSGESGGAQSFVGDSAEMGRLKLDIRRVAPTEAAVLVRGESGVGKELVARAIHDLSKRSGRPFVCLNCAALSESLLESELFGHEKGSFTGATGRKRGKFEQAHRGTLLLDEVGEMSLSIQAKFLRVLEGHPFERVGGSETVKVDVRVVAATNRDLEQAVKEGRFRRDLYFRLHVVQIVIPPLRERASDIRVLSEHFVRQYCEMTGRNDLQGLSSGAREKLMSYHWPGNVRELEHVVERAVILATGPKIEPDDLLLSRLEEPDDDTKDIADKGDISLYALEKKHILDVLEKTQWNKSRSAKILGIERSTLDRKLKRYGVSRPRPQL